MRILIAAILVFGSFSLNAQNIRFKVEGIQDSTVHLVKYFGKGLFYADTAQMKNGVVEFDGSKQKPGMLALFFPKGQQMLDFVYSGEEDINIESKLPDLMGNARIKKSEENKIFMDYTRMIKEKRGESDRYKTQRNGHDEGSEQYEELTEKIKAVAEYVINYQKNIAQNHSDKLAGKIIKLSTDIEIPDAPVDSEGNVIDPNFRFNYYRTHYWDNVDLKDNRLVGTPMFHNKLANYFSKQMMVQHWDTVIYYAYDFCDRLDTKGDMFQYCVSWITSNYEQSKIMGMDKVFVAMGKRYYCGKCGGPAIPEWDPNYFRDMPETWVKRLDIDESVYKDGKSTYKGRLYFPDQDSSFYMVTPQFQMYKSRYAEQFEMESCAFWLNDKPEKLAKLCEKVEKNKRLVIGEIPPNITLRDTTDVNWRDFYSLESEYTILYFWDPECGHCKKITPKLQTLYEKKFRDRDIEIFAVGKAVGEDFDKWKKFVKKHNLEFINVAVTDKLYTSAMEDARRFVPKYTTLESLNYQQTYDIYATPKVWVLDKDKKIIAKSLTVSQLEDLMDRLQQKTDVEKIFPPEENTDDEQMH